MRSLKAFIVESEEQHGKVTSLELEDAIKIVKEKCALQTPEIWRGSKGLTECSLISTSGMSRKSRDSSGWVNFLFDSSPHLTDFPKRSKSLICSSDKNEARQYAADVYFVLPIKSSKIAWCIENDDFIHTESTILTENLSLQDFELSFEKSFMKPSIESLNKIDKQIREAENPSLELLELFHRTKFHLHNGNEKKFKETLLKDFNPENLKVKMRSPEEKLGGMPPYFPNTREVWIEGECILIHESLRFKFEEAMKK